MLDACFARAAGLISDFDQQLGPRVLYSCRAEEETFQLELGQRRPVDFERRYPQEIAWLREQARREQRPYDKRLTFTGLMWLRAWLQTPQAPQNHADWKSFLSRVIEAGEEFRRERSQKLASTLLLIESSSP
ncbi:MAG: hypothetical protein HC904_03990 [Blastochloris sp.]|nr:hypothetical protein [Blastochloris sp.]